MRALRAALDEGARLYLRPLAGRRRHALMEAQAGRGPGAARALLAPAGLERFLATLEASTRTRAETLLQRIEDPRPRVAGLDGARPLVMGVVNATPDSFSDQGETLAPERAVAAARALVADGADLVDLGAESTRPGAAPTPETEELRRLTPILAALRAAPLGAALSLDSRRAGAMAAALEAGATVLNDVSAFRDDPRALPLAAAQGAALVLMHRGPAPNERAHYDDPAAEVFDFLEARIEACLAAGVARERIIVDPGFGFGKSGRHDRAILARLSLLQGLGAPIMVGVSRKGLTRAHETAHAPRARWPGSLAAAMIAARAGAQIFRVHDVARHVQAFRLMAALDRGG